MIGAGSGSSGRLSDEAWPLIAAGCASIFSTLVSVVSLWTHLKQYRKPIMQRYVVRIMLMVPLYAIASWCSLLSFTAADFIDPLRDVYEAFVIYCFFNLLINYLGGERSIIIMTHGRAPKPHPWPMRYCLAKVDISDPYTFLTIKRGILQYAWLKPLLALATVVMKATGTFQEGYIGLSSGYFWSGLLYNVSITLSLYCLAMFWVCLHEDLVPFRPVPKFLVIKLVIFASYWQGFALSLLVAAGWIPDSPGYSADNISVAIQDLLTCFEMPFFALAHWYAFSVSDYADPTIGSARMTILYATRDAFGPGDLIVDTKETLFGRGYDYQLFDPSENVMAHAESGRLSRIKEGLRYERGGKGKHWVPQPGETSVKTPLLNHVTKPGYAGLRVPDFEARYNAFAKVRQWNEPPPIALDIDEEDEALFEKARSMEFGDYNFPVVEVQRRGNLARAQRDKHFQASTSSHQAVLKQPPKGTESGALHKGKKKLTLQSHPSRIGEIRDLQIEDPAWEERERMRLRKEGGPVGHENDDDIQRFIRLPGPSENKAQNGRRAKTNTDPAGRSNSRTLEADEVQEDAGSSDEESKATRARKKIKESLLSFKQQHEENPWK